MPENARLGREPFEALLIGQDFCDRTYGVDCDATLATGLRKCFNTRHTCQDPANYSRGTLWLRFCKSISGLPKTGYYHPLLKSVEVTPGQINPGGANRSMSALGSRATLSASFIDAPSPDRVTDKYQAERISGAAQLDGVGYDPLSKGTFWTKWRARNPYYLNRPVQYVSGYLVDGEIVDAITRTFFITGFSGPDAKGNVSIQATDVLTLIENTKAKAPALSEGRLENAIDEDDLSVTLTPPGIGDSKYPASGLASIGDEIVSYTRSGDTCTIVRAQRGSKVDSHDAGALFQVCLVYDAQRPDFIMSDLCTTYGGIGAQYLDTDGWEAEVDDYLQRLYSIVVPKPTGVSQLVGELAEVVGFNPWWDERNDLLKIRALRPLGDEAVYDLEASRHLVKDSVTGRDRNDQLITQVWVYYGIRNPTGDIDDPLNYAACELAGDLEAAGADMNRGDRIKVIFARWIPNAGGAAALELAEKVLAMFKRAPREVSFSLDAKDRDVWVGSFARIKCRQFTDDIGDQVPLNIQVVKASEQIPGTRFSYVGHTYVAETFVQPNEKLIMLSGLNNFNINLRDAYDSTIGITPEPGEHIRFILRSGARIGGKTQYDLDGNAIYTGRIRVRGYSTGVITGQLPIVQSQSVSAQQEFSLDQVDSLYGTLQSDVRMAPVSTAFDTGLWPENPVITIVIEAGAGIRGQGANGGIHYGIKDGSDLYIAADGGHAMRIRHPVSIDNRGIIAAGCGGGAGVIKSPVKKVGGSGGNNVVPGLIIPGGGGQGWPGGNTVGPYIRGGFYSSSTTPGAGDFDAPGVAGQSNQVLLWYTGGSIFFQYANWVVSGEGGKIVPRANILGYSESDMTGGDSSAVYTELSYFPVTARHGGDLGLGGVAGKAIAEGAGLITWINRGAVYGAQQF